MLTKDQTDHLKNRLAEIQNRKQRQYDVTYNEKVQELNKKYPAPIALTDADKVNWIKTGKAKLNTQLVFNYSSYLFSSFTYPADDLYEVGKKELDTARDAFRDTLADQANVILDNIVFNGAKDVQALLEKFENSK